MTTPEPQPGILDIAPYVGGCSSASGVSRVIKLSSNEGAFGPSPKSIEAGAVAAREMHRYPDGEATALRDAIAKTHGVDAGRVICGAGSDEIISLLCNAYTGPGDEVLYSEHGFLMYSISARAAGATPVTAPEQNYTVDVDALLAALTGRTKIVFVANPNNPTGTYVPMSEIERLWQGLPEYVLLVIDAAYAEFVTHDDYAAGEALVDRAQNVVMTRTFSKLYSLGGVRLGWGYGPQGVIDVLHRVRGPFNVNASALAMGLAALEDTAFAAMVRDETIRIRDHIQAELEKLQVKVVPSVGNFLIMSPGIGAGRDAEACDAYLKARGILVRRVAGYGLPDFLRVSIGTEEEMEIFLETVRAFLFGEGDDQ